MEERSHPEFSAIHPTVMLVYAVLAFAVAMVSMQPVLSAMAFIGSVSFGFFLDGWRQSLRRLGWQVSVVVAVALLNCLFAQRGATVLFSIGPFSVHAECLVYGACMGAVLAASLTIMLNAAEMVSSDDALALTGGRLPTISLMVSMSLKLVPQLQRQSGEIRDVRAACTCRSSAMKRGEGRGGGNAFGRGEGEGGDACSHSERGKKGTSSRHRQGARELTTLMASAMEDSLVTADSMRARGWFPGMRRTLYRRLAFRASDACAVVAIAVLGVACLVFAWLSSSSFGFYPVLDIQGLVDPLALVGVKDPAVQGVLGPGGPSLSAAVSYAAYALFFFIPHLAWIAWRIRWMR